MRYKITVKSQKEWEDEVCFVQYSTSHSFSSTKLSKRLLLLKFAESIKLTKLEILILDNLSKVHAFVYNHNDNELLLKLDDEFEISLTVDWSRLEKLLTPCTIAQF